MSTFAVSKDAQIFFAICDEAQTPVAYKASLAGKRGDWLSVVRTKVRPQDYPSAKEYLSDAQVISFLKKHPAVPTGLDRKRAALDSFYAAEKQCYLTNERLNPLFEDPLAYGERIHGIIREWRKEIRSVLKSAPTLADLEPRFGPGSTFGNRGNLITVPDKFDENFSATLPALRAFGPVWDQTAWSRYACANLVGVESHDLDAIRAVAASPSQFSPFATRDFTVVRGNRFTSVSKTALTDRGICVEPSLNVFYQLAVGEILTTRLKWAYGWDKKIVQGIHRILARLGSLTGSNATIDLSSASDTVCRNLVKLLLPPRWHELLCNLRSERTLVNGHWVHNEKFSSMGNGYTFELETLIFLTLAHVVERHVNTQRDTCDFGHAVSCFGDDIIVPVSVGPSLVAALQFFGFQVNNDKTFLSGPFRESCGGDYFSGYDVRPHFQKEELNEPSNSIACANGLLRNYRRLDAFGYTDRRFARVKALNGVPRLIRRCYGPEELGDLVIHGEPMQRWDIKVRNSIRYIKVWRPVANRKIDVESHFRPSVVLTSALYLAGSETAINAFEAGPDGRAKRAGLTPRVNGSFISGHRFGRVPFS